MSINLNFTQQDWNRITHDWTAWWAHELDRPMVVIDPPSYALYEFATSFPLETPTDEVIDYYQSQLETRRFYGDTWPKWWPNFGPGIAAGFMGT